MVSYKSPFLPNQILLEIFRPGELEELTLSQRSDNMAAMEPVAV